MASKTKHLRFIVCVLQLILATNHIAVAQIKNDSVICTSEIDVYVSSRAGDRIAAKKSAWSLSNQTLSLPIINVNTGIRYQKIEGFGASFNEAGMLCLNTLTTIEKEKVIKSLFDSVGGSGFTLMKSPISACDFSSAGPWYSYNDTPNDLLMSNFSIQRDLGKNGLIPYIKMASKFGKFKIEAPMDFAPDWMYYSLNPGEKHIRPEYYSALALYYSKYLQAYEAQGIHIDYLNLFNEAQNSHYSNVTYSEIGDLIKNYVAPQLRADGVQVNFQLGETSTRPEALEKFPDVLDDVDARAPINSLTVHGYDFNNFSSLTELHNRYPELPIWMTEVCYYQSAALPSGPVPQLPISSFSDGEFWGNMIINDMKNWVSAWIYWNMILDEKGGPWLVSPEHGDPDGNVQQPVVIINRTTKKVSYTGIYYYLSHFSKFIKPGAHRIDCTGGTGQLNFVGFQNTDSSIVLNILNNGKEIECAVNWNNKTTIQKFPAHSITTLKWCGSNAEIIPTVTIPAKIEAEAFVNTLGGQKEICSEGGQDVALTQGAWADYLISVPNAGAYTFSFRVASAFGGQLQLWDGETPLNDYIDVPATGNSQSFTTVSKVVNLRAGQMNLGVLNTAGNLSLNWFEVTSGNCNGPDNTPPAITLKPGATVFLDADGNYTIQLNDVLQSLTDNCDPNPGATVINSQVNCSHIGSGGGSSAPHQAYVSNTSTGNSSFSEELGLMFTVNDPNGIVIDKLGAFDHLGDGISGTQGGGVRVAVFNESTRAKVPGLDATIIGTSEPLVGNYRVHTLSSAVTLPPGNYVLVAKGYSASEMFYNRKQAGPLNPTGDGASGTINFSNNVYWGASDPSGFGFPANTASAGNPNEYIAGTFNYTLNVSNSVTVTATDASGNQSQATTSVTVVDTFYVLTAKNITVNPGSNGQATITAADVLQSLKNNCGADVTGSTLQVTPSSFTCADIAAGGLTASPAPHQAYVSNTSTGNSSFSEELGLMFTVNDPNGIVIDKLGAFDHLGDGISGTQGGGVRVAVFNESTRAKVPGLDATIIGTSEPLLGNYRVHTLSSAVTLPPGNYVLVAKGYSASEMFYNRKQAGPLNPTGDGGSGTLSFSNNVYWGASDPSGFGFPANTASAGNPNEYIAGTFSYNTFIAGGITVTLTAIDAYGNQKQAAATVVVKDNIGPSIITKNLTINLDATGRATIQPNDVLQSPATDNCAVNTVVVSPNSFSCSDYSTSGDATTHQAYISNASIGNSSFSEELGLLFTVNDPNGIVIDKLGAFDDAGNGISGTQAGGVRVAVFNESTRTKVTGLDATLVGTSDPLVGNYRMHTLSSAVTLPPGNYVLVAKGYSASEMFYNRKQAGPLNPTGDGASGTVSFSNNVYWGASDPSGFGFPANTASAGNPNEYIAGTFNYALNVSNNKLVTITATDTHGNVTNATAVVTLADPNAACSTAPMFVQVDQIVVNHTGEKATGLLGNDLNVKVYPNPSTGQFTVRLSNLKVRKVTVQVINQTGKIVEQNTIGLTGKIASLTIPVNIKNQAPGVYFVKIISDEGVRMNKIIVVR